MHCHKTPQQNVLKSPPNPAITDAVSSLVPVLTLMSLTTGKVQRWLIYILSSCSVSTIRSSLCLSVYCYNTYANHFTSSPHPHFKQFYKIYMYNRILVLWCILLNAFWFIRAIFYQCIVSNNLCSSFHVYPSFLYSIALRWFILHVQRLHSRTHAITISS